MRLWVADFGLIPLVWLPTGQSAATLNGRYAAPELFDRRPSRSADQYSLRPDLRRDAHRHPPAAEPARVRRRSAGRRPGARVRATVAA